MKLFGCGIVFKLTRTKRKEQLAVEMNRGLLLTPCPIFDDLLEEDDAFIMRIPNPLNFLGFLLSTAIIYILDNN